MQASLPKTEPKMGRPANLLKQVKSSIAIAQSELFTIILQKPGPLKIPQVQFEHASENLEHFKSN